MKTNKQRFLQKFDIATKYADCGLGSDTTEINADTLGTHGKLYLREKDRKCYAKRKTKGLCTDCGIKLENGHTGSICSPCRVSLTFFPQRK